MTEHEPREQSYLQQISQDVYTQFLTQETLPGTTEPYGLIHACFDYLEANELDPLEVIGKIRRDISTSPINNSAQFEECWLEESYEELFSTVAVGMITGEVRVLHPDTVLIEDRRFAEYDPE